MRISVQTNLDQVFADMDRFVASARQAMPRAINKLRDQAQVAAAREIASIYKIGVRDVQDSKFLRIKQATPEQPSASIIMGGPGLSMSLFQPRNVKGKGVSVAIKGRRFLIPGAFLATMRSGKQLVVARGAYGGKSGRRLKPTGRFGRFIFGRGERVKAGYVNRMHELPINAFYTFSLGQAFANDAVVRAAQDRIEEQAAAVIKRELQYAAR